MQMLRTGLVKLLLAAWLFAGTSAMRAEPLKIIDVVISERVRVAGVDQELWLRGHAKLDRNMLPWYAVTLHGDPRVRRREAWSEGLEPCRITLVWMENEVAADEVHAYFSELFVRTIPAVEFQQIAPQLEEFVATLPAAKRGQRWRFDYWPDGGMRFFVDDVEVRQVYGFDLNKAILGLWLGRSADNTVRALLTDQLR